ncbi:MAG: heme A synthase [Corynebacterium sp.]|nr:heme A synthase [Corynebacterium sp.]
MTQAQTDPQPQGRPKRWAPTIRTQQRLALALLIGQGGITATGATVRVTGSGLGCNTWPNCHEGSLVPVAGAAPWIQQAIEFGNRLLTFVLVALAAAVFLALKSAHRRTELMAHAWAQIGGIVVQAVIGGISVRLDLQWWAVALHFMPSMVLVWLAAILYLRIPEPDDGVRTPTFPAAYKILAAVAATMLFVVLITGTMVTGAGVHSGDAGIGMEGRLDVDIDLMAHIHAWCMYAYLALTLFLAVGLYLRRAPQRTMRFALWLISLILVQAAIGIIQYRLGIPAWTIPVHVGMSAVVTAFTAMLWATGIVRREGTPTVTGSLHGDHKRAALLAEKAQTTT